MSKKVVEQQQVEKTGNGKRSKPTERRVPFETLEAWLIVATNKDIDAHERLGWLQSAIAWTLGKDSKIANHLMTQYMSGIGKRSDE